MWQIDWVSTPGESSTLPPFPRGRMGRAAGASALHSCLLRTRAVHTTPWEPALQLCPALLTQTMELVGLSPALHLATRAADSLPDLGLAIGLPKERAGLWKFPTSLPSIGAASLGDPSILRALPRPRCPERIPCPGEEPTS